jgi:hypothetical protein
MTINELLVTEIKAKSELAKKAIEKYEEYGYNIAFTNIVTASPLVRAEIKNGEEIAINVGATTMEEIVLFFENQISVELP